MTTIENQRALDPIIDGLVKRLRAIECKPDDLKHVVTRILKEAMDGAEYQRIVELSEQAAGLTRDFQSRFNELFGIDLEVPNPFVPCIGGQGTEHIPVRTFKNFQLQAENAAKGCCCGSQETIREVGDAIRKEVTAGNIKLVADTHEVVTNALTAEQIATVKAMRDVPPVKPDPGTGKHISVTSVPIPAKVQKAIERGLELGPDAADSSVRSSHEAQ
jgi:hypothetical protein